MALWKDQSNTKKDATADGVAPVEDFGSAFAPPAIEPAAAPPVRRTGGAESPESVIGADLSIEGSISGKGNVRLAGRFTGDVTVDGTVSIEPGAKLNGGVRATTVSVSGELEGSIVEAQRVDVHASGAVIGDVKARMLTLAAGARVKGHIECGWTDKAPRADAQVSRKNGTESAVTP